MSVWVVKAYISLQSLQHIFLSMTWRVLYFSDYFCEMKVLRSSTACNPFLFDITGLGLGSDSSLLSNYLLFCSTKSRISLVVRLASMISSLDTSINLLINSFTIGDSAISANSSRESPDLVRLSESMYHLVGTSLAPGRILTCCQHFATVLYVIQPYVVVAICIASRISIL